MVTLCEDCRKPLPRDGYCRSCRYHKRPGRSGPTQIALDEAKAKAAFDVQVDAGELEAWTKDIWTDAYLRGYYQAKAETRPARARAI